METAIRWSPSSNTREQRFLYVDVAGKSFKLCRPTTFNGKSIEYEVLSTHNKVPAFRAFDWSTADESLIAVGQSSGEATILRLGGEISNETWSFPIRNQRYCNAVAFSTHGLLATGLDKVRTDYCLNIFDVNQRLSAGNARGLGADRHALEPLRKLASSEPITSIKFFRDQPDTLVTGVKGAFVRIYDLREGPGNPSIQFPTKCVHNLAIDWLDENYIASCSTSNESTICLWDRRVGARLSPTGVANSGSIEPVQSGAALELNNVLDPKASIWSVRFSKTKRGCLGVLSNTGHFKAYELAKEYQLEEYRSYEDTIGPTLSRNLAEPIYTKYMRDVRSPFNHPTRGCSHSERVVSFDFMNMNRATNEPSAIALLGSGKVEVATLQPPGPPVRLSSQGILIQGSAHGSRDLTVLTPSFGGDGKVSDAIQRIRRRVSIRQLQGPDARNTSQKSPQKQSTHEKRPLSSRENRESSLYLGTTGAQLPVRDALTMTTIPRFRCKEGYLFNSNINQQVTSDDPALCDFWDWIKRAREASSAASMIVNRLDMNYLGVFHVWMDDLGPNLKSRMLGWSDKDAFDVDQIIKDLVQQLDLPEGKGCDTEFLEHRQLCLRICGAVESQENLEELVQQLVAQRQHTKAAALAVFQDEPKLAFAALRTNEPTQAHKLLAMAIAGAARGNMDSDWEETCAEIAKELTDPYARAILALVSNGDWNSVLRETTLPLRYKVEVALRWLPDDDLTDFLRKTTVEAVKQGDIEGIVLTGLGHSAMDLFQSYINKFNDIQTPVLAMSHTIPRFVDDDVNKARFHAWREIYRLQMNSWKLQLERAKFDVGSRKFAITWDGRKLVSPPMQQISLTCNYCTRPLNQEQPDSSGSSSLVGEIVHQTLGHPLGSATMSGVICPKCGRHMPRCGICSLWLGSPDPMSRAEVVADAKKDNKTVSAGDLLRRFVVFCINCNHGFHAHHAQEWFSRHQVCPVAECSCMCDR